MCFKIWVLLRLWWVCCLVAVRAFNLDTRFPIFFSGPPDSYFGFNVALHHNSKGSVALVSATRDNSTVLAKLDVIRSGVLYQCRIATKNCKQVILDTRGNVGYKYGLEKSYTELKNDMWLGVSLDVQPEGDGKVVTCGHLWKNQHYPNHYLVNGVCYIANRELDTKSVKTLIPLVDKSRQSIQSAQIYYFAFGQAGTSATFSENGNDLLLGAPGFYDWIGTAINYRISRNIEDMGPPIIPNPPGDQQPSSEAYIGYSVTTGRFFQLGGMSFVAGAPRDANNKGRVYIFEALGYSKKDFIVQQKKEGTQMGEYFGAVVLGMKLNKDDYTDLVVSAPTFSLSSAGGDEGRVFVYVSDGVGLQDQAILYGNKVPGARFGMALANAGDLNQDGYTDLAIGAPYENEKGAIYIYHGTEEGIKSVYSQHISASELDNNLRGFGISISRGKDMDYNHYPDLLIGAYASDQAVLLRSHPVIHVWPQLDFDISQIVTDVKDCTYRGKSLTCFTARYCLKYNGVFTPPSLDFIMTLRVDTKRSEGQERGFLLNTDVPATIVKQTKTFVADTEECLSEKIFLHNDVQEFLNPMEFQMQYDLVNHTATGNSFCPTCPVIDQSSASNVYSNELRFQIGCGKDEVCVADLRLEARIMDYRSGEVLIIGQNNSLAIEIKVTNQGEPAYETQVDVILPPVVSIINQAHCDSIKEHEHNSTSPLRLQCNIDNPLRDSHMPFQIKLDTSKLSNDVEEIQLELFAKTASQEKEPKDNRVILTLPFRAEADIAIVGVTAHEQILYGQATSKADIYFTHTYVVTKYLASPIRSVQILLSIPTTKKHSKEEFIRLQNVEISGSASSPVSGSCNVTLINLDPGQVQHDNSKEISVQIGAQKMQTTQKEDGINIGTRKKKSTENSAWNSPLHAHSTTSQPISIDCATSICKMVTCAAGPFMERQRTASIKVTSYINVTALENALEKNWYNLSITSQAKVWIRDTNKDIQPEPHRPDSAMVTTLLIKEGSLPPKQIAKWIIAVSAGVGVLLIVLILLALIHLGFFRRKKKEDMEKMMQQAAMDDWDPYLVTEDDGPQESEEFYNGTCKNEDRVIKDKK